MPNLTILIVDDDEDTRLLVRSALEEDGLDFREAENVSAAWAELETEAPNLILSDYEMPGGDGFELLRRVREDARFAAIPVIMLTGHNQIDRALEGMSIGTSDYIVKPFNIEDLRGRVRFQLENSPGVGKSVLFPDGGDRANRAT